MDYEDIVYTEEGRTATIRINRPKVYNAFRPRTVVELINAFLVAGWNSAIGSSARPPRGAVWFAPVTTSSTSAAKPSSLIPRCASWRGARVYPNVAQILSSGAFRVVFIASHGDFSKPSIVTLREV